MKEIIVCVLGVILISIIGKPYLDKTFIDILASLIPALILGILSTTLYQHLTEGLNSAKLYFFFPATMWFTGLLMTLFVWLNFQFASSKVQSETYKVEEVSNKHRRNRVYIKFKVKNTSYTIFLEKEVASSASISSTCKMVSIPLRKGLFGIKVFDPDRVRCY